MTDGPVPSVALTKSRRSLGEVYRILKPTLTPHRFEFFSGVLLVFLSTLLEVFSPILLGRGVDLATSADKNRNALIMICLWYLGLIFLKAVVEACQGFVIQRTGQKIIHDLRTLIFERIHGLSISYFDRNPTGRLLTRVINDIKSLSELFTASISVLILDVLVIMGTIGAMFWMHWRLASYVLVSFPAVIWTVWYFGERLSVVYKKVRAKLAEINSFLGENIGAISTIQRLGAEEARYATFKEVVEGHNDAQMESLKVFSAVQPIANGLNGIAMATLLGVGGYWVVQGEISIGVIVTFLAYLRNLFQPIRDLVEKYNTFLSAMVAAERVVGILEEPVEEEKGEKKEAFGPIPTTLSGVVPDTSIVFKGISFQYPSRHRVALDKIDFQIPHGSSLAIVGPTGSGKSTLVRLLLRFYEATEGSISLGGRDIREFPRQELRKKIGVLHQDIYLFRGSIRENLILGRKGIRDEYLIEQCQRIHFWNYIESRGGLEMEVYEGGTNLSLGERQLLSFVRLLIFNPEVLIMDEATASVDRLSEKRLMEAVQVGMRGRTSIIIAHRLSTISACDKVLVLESGRVSEMGTYTELLTHGRMFSRFHEIHTSR